MATRYIINLSKAFLFYLLLFALCRAVFLLYFAHQLIPLGIGIFFLSLYKALPLDISAASYLLLLPLLILFLAHFLAHKLLMGVLRFYLFFTAAVCALLAIAEIGIYLEVHVKLYFNLLVHLQHADEVIYSISLTLLLTLLSLVALLSYASVRFLRKLFPNGIAPPKPIPAAGILKLSITFLLAGTILVLGCRGGLRPVPISEGEAYFSDNQCVNDATVNPLWNIVYSFIETRRALQGNAYKVMPDQEASEIVNKLFSVEKDTTIHLFKVARPNVCVLILESWSADLIAPLGGYTGLTPNFEKLVNEGYLFTHIKPAGHASDHGVPAVLSGYPALPIGSSINQPEHQVHLSNINDQFSQAGYYSSFFFGGHLIYGNIKTYIFQNKFDRVTEQQDLPSSIPCGRLGIHDSIMLSIWRDSMNTYRQPFLTGLFTLSTHAPFDAPGPQVVAWGDLDQPYLNSAAYADRQLGKFFEDAKKEKWYDSTIFIIVADHSHTTPRNYDYDRPELYHIPLLIYGGALKEEFRGVKNERLASQTDIASTLLHQLGYTSAPYRWSKNLMNPYSRPFAFYTFDEGFGFADSSGTVIWNKKFPSDNRNTAKTPEDKSELYKKGAAVLQILMKDFLSK
jgi:phosphoglycerol transferase MdoB-like AlkP superfamily enzyme